ncbi:MAG: hypothetical protein JJ953_13995 [Gracilimonas sp.]|uniref:hypothetical protein n=1 Tax=Gracilimonas TaxID=649462 RepID=UPI001B09C2F7|nr:hypothetical protein [Gracilimonas sp.]MBO6587217.1 hypothetical protein [Gracilimonas sp.]MBO6614295.1 hypothetical protein [Gracilimonas sp.]
MKAKKYLIKAVLIAAYVLFHIYLLRPVRTAIFQYQVDEKLVESVQESQYLSFQKLDTRLAVFEYSEGNSEKLFFYKVPFGSFFFLGMIGLILIGADKKFFIVLISAHSVILISASFVLMVDIVQNLSALHILDFLSTYLAPLSALGVIPLSLFYKRNNHVSNVENSLAKG